MADPDNRRPDPDSLLRTLDEAARQATRGKLRIYFGASAGVGKTYAMLAAARAQQAGGADVVAGIVETHGRQETAGLLDGLEQLPLRPLPHRGRELREFDLDGALARRPALILVDELAHSNAPGARHAKRWQDVHELMAAGIDVWTTLNVQHLDSLNEAVGGITGVRVWETVPDAVFDAADEVILVDTSADELLRRLREGKVYLGEQASHAGRHFFRKGNLIALRELALRRTADHVDDDVQSYRRDRAIETVWRTREALVACIGAGADAEHVVRSAHRLAQELDCDWHVITLDAPRVTSGSQAARGRLERALALAGEMGARIETLPGGDRVLAVANYARRHNITKIVLGRGRADAAGRARPSWSAALGAALEPGWIWHRRSFADALAAACPDIDVIRLGAPPHSPPPRDAAGAAPAGAGARLHAGYLWALLYCGVATALSALAFPLLHQTNIVMLFLLAVVAVALRHGRGPAALASVLSVGLFDFFFVQPLASFAVSDVQYLLTFLVLLGVGLLIGQLTAGLRLQARTSIRREAEARGLYEFARELSSALQPQQIVASADAFIQAAFGARCALFILGLDERLAQAAAPGQEPGGLDPAVAQWVYDHGQPAGAGTATLATSALLYLPLKAPLRARGVLAVENPARAAFSGPDARRLIETYATLIAIALERLHYVDRGTGGRGPGRHARGAGRPCGDRGAAVALAAGGMRRRADRAGAVQPAGERRQVHAGRRRHPARGDGARGRPAGKRERRRARRTGRRCAAHFREVHARRARVGHPRGRPGPGRLRSHRAGAPRPHLGGAGARAGARRPFRLHSAAGRAAGRPARPRLRRPCSIIRPGSCSSKTTRTSAASCARRWRAKAARRSRPRPWRAA